MKKIASFSMVKDECDIIELFVRINLRFVDRMFLIDNQSSDGTIAIIQRMQKEGLPVTLWHDNSVDYQQSLVSTNAIRKIFEEYQPEWIVPLDADEFLTENGREFRAELESIPENHCGMLQWRTFVPLSVDYASLENPLWHNFRQRAKETTQFSKVVIPAALATNSKLSPGNHHLLTADNRRIPTVPLTTTLAHVPVRSSEQIVAKSIIGSIKHQITWNRLNNEGFHKEIMAETVRNCNYRLDIQQLQELAFTYSQRPGKEVIREIDNTIHLGTKNDCIQYRELAVINIIERFDSFMQELGNALQQENAHAQIKQAVAYETRDLLAALEEKEKEIRFFRKTAIGKAISYLAGKKFLRKFSNK
ncbi:glycosyltransferase family 2 protein [Chlorobaculum parvum]|nr:glycosyltransferase family 2 protein [Chlorobaculum parvum]